MLRISQVDSEGIVTFYLQGKLLSPWIGELDDLVGQVPDQVRIHMDLAGVSFVDPRGAEYLAGLRRRGVQLHACSPFVAELIDAYGRRREGPDPDRMSSP